ncbi:RHS repeat-associated core domain-containing protein [Segatella baroniae]|uniref:RHS repeat-associated core domain-containing protein n=1 Tax=Segatella baroniae TaxID=305719 RepID=UPI0009DBB268|nr:RHS repeat-associated core domain-containing protein [Segatella baroniae]
MLRSCYPIAHSSTNYYPFGTPFAHEDTSIQPLKYNGKELDKVHGLNTYDYGVRQYNSVVLVWNKVDPLCELFQDVSPFTY